MKKIIDSRMSGFERVKLISAMQDMLTESIFTCPPEDRAWYKDCTMEDYFTWQEIYDDNGEFLGEGLDVISAAYIINDETKADFEECFEQARDEAIKNTKE